MAKRKYKITVYYVEGPVVERIESKKPEYAELRAWVGGLIQYVPLRKMGKELIVNEEGLIIGLPRNPHKPTATIGTIWEGEPFVGNIVQIETIKS